MRTTPLSVLILCLASVTPVWSQETTQEESPPQTSPTHRRLFAPQSPQPPRAADAVKKIVEAQATTP